MQTPSTLASIPRNIPLLIALLMPAVAFGAPVFTSVHPDSGPVGTQVILGGSGFEAQTSYIITVNGVEARLDQVTEDSIKFTILGGTGTGLVEIDDGTGPISSGLPFQVTRFIPGVFVPPQGVSREGYTIIDGRTPLALTAGNGAFNVSVPVDIPKVLAVFRDESDPVFMAIVMPSDASITVNATSTAEALAYMSPLLSTRDKGQAQLTIGKIRSRSEVASLASLIEGISGNGRDYLNDARLETGLLNLVQATLT